MRLSELLDYDNIVIQCHDNPDADALACGYAVYLYLQEHGKTSSIIYGGRSIIRKGNLKLMIEQLHIPIIHVDTLEKPSLLLTVDCQYGGGNVTHFDAEQVAVIDHHRVSVTLPKMNEVRSFLGACSTLIWQMLKDEQYDVNGNEDLATALYYGLYMDTGNLAEIAHPLDKDLRDEAAFNKQKLALFRNANLSIEDLEIAGAALMRSDYIEEYRCSIVKAGECDPNLLGIISDLVLEVDAVDVCLVFCVMQSGVKFSVRSCVKEVQANDLAEVISKGIGSGGGHIAKAGGYIPIEMMIPEYQEYCRLRNTTPRMVLGQDGKSEYPSESAIKAVLERRMVDYFENSEIIYENKGDLCVEEMAQYHMRPFPMGYIRAADIFEMGTAITFRTLSRDVDLQVEEDLVILIGLRGEIFVTKEDRLQNSYRVYDWKYSLSRAEYKPVVKNNVNGESISLMKYAKVCIPNGKYPVHARQLEHDVKIFTRWDESKYLIGRAGDYLVIHEGKTHDLHILAKDVFEQCHRPVDESDTSETRAVIFDLDGTLLDTLQDLTNAVNVALRSKGMPERSLDEVRQFVGNGVEQLMIRAVPDGKNNPQFEAVLQTFRTYYQEHCKDNTKPYPDLLLLMEELKQRGIRMAIVSNKPDAAVKELDREHFKGYTSAAIGEMEGVARKPAPDTLEKALKELGTTKEQTVYIGDSETDIETAKNAGLRCISVTWGFRSKKQLIESGAEQLIEKPIELLLYI